MDRNLKETFAEWEISLNRNVHMYTHALSLRKGEIKLSVDCEDLPTEVKAIGIWLHNLNIPEALKIELQELLRQWTKKFDVKFKIYATSDNFVTNVSDT